jgi:hypothetical protein
LQGSEDVAEAIDKIPSSNHIIASVLLHAIRLVVSKRKRNCEPRKKRKKGKAPTQRL